ncbi:hypothetical protein DIPPA_11534 [Diplonema papillatum]|nr:hypothetical protein DIPPA_11534 [Diplonema papillatum]|eukprot:gene21913-33670_t
MASFSPRCLQVAVAVTVILTGYVHMRIEGSVTTSHGPSIDRFAMSSAGEDGRLAHLRRAGVKPCGIEGGLLCVYGQCIDGVCQCSHGYRGAACDACAAAFSGYPKCATDDKCYALSWQAPCPAELQFLRNEGLLPGRPRRGIIMVGAEAHLQKSVLGVQIVPGLWSADTVSLKLCWVLSCGSRHNAGGRVCKWENSTASFVYVRNQGCGIDVARKPSRSNRAGAGFKGECEEDPSVRWQQICALPSKRHITFVRDVSWYMTVDAYKNVYLEASNWRGHFIRVNPRPMMGIQRPDPATEGFFRLHPLDGLHEDYCS